MTFCQLARYLGLGQGSDYDAPPIALFLVMLVSPSLQSQVSTTILHATSGKTFKRKCADYV